MDTTYDHMKKNAAVISGLWSSYLLLYRVVSRATSLTTEGALLVSNTAAIVE